MNSKTRALALATLSLCFFVAGDLAAQGKITQMNKKKTGPPTSVKKVMPPTKTFYKKIVSTHDRYVKPLMAMWEKKTPFKPIRDHVFAKAQPRDSHKLHEMEPCTLAFWKNANTVTKRGYWIVPLKEVYVKDAYKVDTTTASGRTFYDNTLSLVCKGGKRCIRYTKTKETSSAFSPRISYTRVSFENRQPDKHENFTNIQAYSPYVPKAQQAVAARPGTPTPTTHQGAKA